MVEIVRHVIYDANSEQVLAWIERRVPLDFTTGRRLLRNEGLLASKGLLHAAAIEAVQRVT